MDILILLIFTLIAFTAFTILRRWKDIFILMAFAIGCGVNAGVYSVLYSPFKLGSITFGYDSVLFTIFSFCVLTALRDHGIKESKEMCLSTAVAIVISGTIEFFFSISNSQGISSEILIKYSSYLFLAVGMILSNILVTKIYLYLGKKKIHVLLRFFISGLIDTTFTYVVYFGAYALVSGKGISDFGSIILGMLVIRAVGYLCASISYLINHYVWKPKEAIPNHEKL